MARLGEVCDVLNGFAFKSEKYIDNGVRIIRIANVQKGYIEDAAPVYYPADDVNAQKYKLEEGDILVSLTGNVGRVGILSKEFLPAALNQRVACLRIKDGVELDRRYLFNVLNSDTFERKCIEAAKGLAQKNLSSEWLKDYELCLPPYNDQIKIAQALDKVSSLISRRKEQMMKLDELVKSRFIEMFENKGLPIKTIEELCCAIVDCPHTTPKYEGELKNPAIRTSEIKKGYIVWDSMRYVSEEEYKARTTKLKPKAGDIVYGREGSFGNAAILPEGYNFCLGQRVMLLRPNDTKCISEYLLYAILSDDVYRQAIEKNNASTVAHVNVNDVKQFKIPLPSLEKQNEFVVFVKQTDKSKFAIQQSLEKLGALKKSLMQRYF